MTLSLDTYDYTDRTCSNIKRYKVGEYSCEGKQSIDSVIEKIEETQKIIKKIKSFYKYTCYLCPANKIRYESENKIIVEDEEQEKIIQKTVTAFYEKEDLLAKESQPTKTLEEILKGAKNQTINKKRRKAK